MSCLKMKFKLNSVEKILDFNNQNQEGQRLKLLTPEPILNRILNSLAHLETGNNSQKLKNKINQLLYSLYRSKTLSKAICEYLMNTTI